MGTGRDLEENHLGKRPISPGRLTVGRSHAVLPQQHAYEHALQLGFEALLARPPSEEKLEALGACRESDTIRVQALNRVLLADLARRDVFVEGLGRAKRAWAVLCVHYLRADDVSVDLREVAFGRSADGRGYADVFQKRIVQRFLATSGRTSERFVELSERLQAKRLPGSGIRCRFDVLPRVSIIVVRYEGDEELEPGANLVYRADAERLLSVEDRVVSAELLLDTLAGKSIEEHPGGG